MSTESATKNVKPTPTPTNIPAPAGHAHPGPKPTSTEQSQEAEKAKEGASAPTGANAGGSTRWPRRRADPARWDRASAWLTTSSVRPS